MEKFFKTKNTCFIPGIGVIKFSIVNKFLLTNRKGISDGK